MPEYRRYQPRRASSGRRWVTYTVWLVVLVVVILIGKALFGGGSKTTTKNKNAAQTNTTANTSEITLLNDNSNTNTAVNGNANSNTNVDVNGNSNVNATTTPASTSIPQACTKAISQYGEQKRIALTFDVSADGEAANQAIAVLQKTKTPASFFASGTFAEKHKEILAQLVKDGFAIYNRTYDNTSLTTITPAAVAQEITKGDEAISAATGTSSKPFLRPPLGAVSDQVVTTAKDAGYCLVTWTVDAFDWQSGTTADQSVQRVLAKVRPGAIVALHLGYDITPAVLDSLIPKLVALGYTLVTLPTLIGS